MGIVIVNNRTTIDPITCIGEFAGYCWGADTADKDKNYKRGLECLSNNHGRTLEFPQVYLIIDGYSARMMRELYTHIGGAPTRLQASTRYIEYGDFPFTTPLPIINSGLAMEYCEAMDTISDSIKSLEQKGVKREDAANLLPLGMDSKMVLRTNLRNLIDMAHQRLCSRAYHEFRRFMKDLMDALSNYSDEWKFVVDKYFVPKCKVTGFCSERYTCKLMPTKKELLESLSALNTDDKTLTKFMSILN